MSFDSRRKLKFSLIFLIKTVKIFNKIFETCSNFKLFVFFKVTVTKIVYSKCFTFVQKHIKINKIFSNFLKVFLNSTKNF